MKSNSALTREEINMVLAYTVVFGVISIAIFGLGYAFGESKGMEEGKRRERELEDMKRMWRES
jgi:hypothetical protein